MTALVILDLVTLAASVTNLVFTLRLWRLLTRRLDAMEEKARAIATSSATERARSILDRWERDGIPPQRSA